MKSLEVIIQDPSRGLGSSVSEALSSLGGYADFNSMDAAVAYASLKGCKELVRLIPWLESGDSMKRWLVGIDRGVTEPAALEYLSALPNSEVRVPRGEELLDAELAQARGFHAKTFLLRRIAGQTLAFGFLTGSANLTFSALHGNVEHCTSAAFAADETTASSESVHLASESFAWFNDAWNEGDVVDPHFVERYAVARGDVEAEESPRLASIDPNEDLEISVGEYAEWAQARCFWVQTYELYKNRGPDRPGNQLDCRRGTRVFFGFTGHKVPRNTRFGDVPIQYNGSHVVSRSVRYANNSMDKLSLPVPGSDGPQDYDNMFLHFERLPSGIYRLTVVSPGNEALWRDKSRAQGMYYTFAHDREYGFYS